MYVPSNITSKYIKQTVTNLQGEKSTITHGDFNILLSITDGVIRWKIRKNNPENLKNKVNKPDKLDICWTWTTQWQNKHSFQEHLPKLITCSTIKQTTNFIDSNYLKYVLW